MVACVLGSSVRDREGSVFAGICGCMRAPRFSVTGSPQRMRALTDICVHVRGVTSGLPVCGRQGFAFGAERDLRWVLYIGTRARFWDAVDR